MPTGDCVASRPLRADARRNYEQLLVAARDAFIELGAGAPLDEIARRAGVGIGTLYRRFLDRQGLMRAVVLDALARTTEAAERALAEAPDPFTALVAYMHAALDLRISAVIPVLLDQLDLEADDLTAARERGAAALQKIVDAAHGAGRLNPEVTFGDVGTLLVRLSRPLPGPVPPAVSDALAHRHLNLLIDGLRPAGAGEAGRVEVGELGGPALDLEDLRGMRA